MDNFFDLTRPPHIAAPSVPNQPRGLHHNSEINALQIRQLQWSDVDAAAEVINSSFKIGSVFGSLLQPLFKLGVCEDLRNRLRSAAENQGTCLVATVGVKNSTLVGTVEISARSLLQIPTAAKRYAYISNLAVDSSHRRLGVGEKLVRQCESIAKDWGYTDIYLHVMANNAAGRRLYKKLGFEELGHDWTWHLFPWQSAERLFLRKIL